MVLNFNKGLKLSEVLREASLFLQVHNFDGDMARTYWLYLFDWDLTRFVGQLNQPQDTSLLDRYADCLERIVKFEPIQYISGHAYFMEDKFKVSPDCLIPREETAGLVERAIDYLRDKPHARVLDIGTGSGIIAIQVKKACPDIDMVAVDISPAALEIAKENASDRHLEIDFRVSDLFEALEETEPFDLILSNPPYIAEDELDWMDESVKRYEPKQALFADNHGLAIYKRIADELEEYLKPAGRAIFEMGFLQGDALKTLFNEKISHLNLIIAQDCFKKERIIVLDLVSKR